MADLTKQQCSICGATSVCHHDDGPTLMAEIERLRPMAESWESYEAAQERKAQAPFTSNLRSALEGLREAVDDLVSTREAYIPFHNANRLGVALGKARAALSGDSSAPETSPDARDADRYRWLRGHIGLGFVVKQYGGDPLGFAGPTLLDEALDAAREVLRQVRLPAARAQKRSGQER